MGINVTGNTVISSKLIKNITNRYLNKCISINIAQEYLLEEIINMYQKKGYILAIPYFPEQNLNTGTLEIIIQEGVLEEIEYDKSVLPSRVVNMAFLGMKGKVINIRNLEQALENLNKFGAVAVNMDLKPGNNSGESILVLKAEEKSHFSGSVSYNNDYNSIDYPSFPNKINHKLNVSIYYAHLLENDNLSLNTSTTLQTDDMANKIASFGFAYYVPIGYWDIIFNANYDIRNTISRMMLDDYNIQTGSLTSSIDIKRTLSRGQSYILKSIIRPNYYTTYTYLDDIKTVAGYKLYYLDLGL